MIEKSYKSRNISHKDVVEGSKISPLAENSSFAKWHLFSQVYKKYCLTTLTRVLFIILSDAFLVVKVNSKRTCWNWIVLYLPTWGQQ